MSRGLRSTFEHIERWATLLDYFLPSIKSTINQYLSLWVVILFVKALKIHHKHCHLCRKNWGGGQPLSKMFSLPSERTVVAFFSFVVDLRNISWNKSRLKNEYKLWGHGLCELAQQFVMLLWATHNFMYSIQVFVFISAVLTVKELKFTLWKKNCNSRSGTFPGKSFFQKPLCCPKSRPKCGPTWKLTYFDYLYSRKSANL